MYITQVMFLYQYVFVVNYHIKNVPNFKLVKQQYEV